MSDEDDLFEFGDFEDVESLELDLEELFGDLEALALDPSALAAGTPNAPAPETATAEAPTEEAPAAQAPVDEASAPAPVEPAAAQTQLPQPQPQPAPVAAQPAAPQPAAPQPVAAPAPQPVVAQAVQPVYVQQPAQPASSTNRLQLATIGFAAVVTLANFAFMALPKKDAAPIQPSDTSTEVASDDQPDTFDPADLALLTRIQELEDQLRGQNDLPDAIPTLPNQRHRAFDDIESQIAAGEYLAARSRLYSLLAVVDRFDPVRAREIEEQASYLLADTYRLELEGQEHNL